MQVCESLDKCGFFNKYETSLNLACKGFIAAYCKGPKLFECERMKFKIRNGHAPEDDMMPSGQTVPQSMVKPL